MKPLIKVMLAGVFISTCTLACPATDMIRDTNFKGGLIVHLGCGDGGLTAALRVNDRCLVHGLGADPEMVAKAREHIQGLGLYGKVSVERLNGRDLPYFDNLVNLLVAEDLGQLPMEECFRVLAPSEKTPDAPTKQVCAVDVETGRILWKKGPFLGIRASKGQDPFGRLELAAGDGKVFILTTEMIECLEADSGESIWRIDRPALPADAVRRIGFAGMYEYLLTVMVYRNGVVLLAQPEPNIHHTYHTMPGTLYAFAVKDGKQMWKHAYGGWGHCTPPDVFVVGDAVWTASTPKQSSVPSGATASRPSIPAKWTIVSRSSI